jgi:hypothetical protein
MMRIGAKIVFAGIVMACELNNDHGPPRRPVGGARVLDAVGKRKRKTARRDASDTREPRIRISVKFLDGRVVRLTVDRNATVARVVQLAAGRVSVCPNELRLYLRTDRLKDAQLLCECGIEAGATLHAVVREVVPLVVRSAYGERRTICVEGSDAMERTLLQACAAFGLPPSQQQYMRLVDRGRVLESAEGTFRTMLGHGVGSELLLTSETFTSLEDHRRSLPDSFTCYQPYSTMQPPWPQRFVGDPPKIVQYTSLPVDYSHILPYSYSPTTPPYYPGMFGSSSGLSPVTRSKR